MSLHDLFQTINVPEVTGTTSFIFTIVIIAMTIIQITPLKINPWDFLLGWVGDRMNSHILKKVETLDEKLTEHIDESRDSSVKRKRERIIGFVEDGMNGKRYTKEAFENIIAECDEYERYIEKYKKKNGVIEATMKEIRERYAKHLHNADFADMSEIDKYDNKPTSY